MKKRMMIFFCSLLLGTSSVALGDALNLNNTTINVILNENGLLSQGIVWQSSRLFTGSGQFTSSSDEKAVTIVLTHRQNIGGGDKVHPNLLKQNNVKLPIELTSGELYLTFLGTIRATWGEATLPIWSANDYLSAVTKPHEFNGYEHEAITFGEVNSEGTRSGTVTYELWPIIYCAKASGCKVPSSSKSFQALYLVMYTGNKTNGSIDTTQLVTSGSFKFESTCNISIYPTSFTNIEMKVGNQGNILWTASSKYSASCSRNGSLYVIFTPSRGMLESDERIGLTNLPSIGVVHRNNSTVPLTSLQQCDSWHEMRQMGTLFSNGLSKHTIEGTVQWGFYQYRNVQSMGTLDTSVNYEFWVE